MITLKVEGMTCGHCEAAVRSALETVPGVVRVTEVSRERQIAVAEGDVAIEALISAVEEEGYRATPVT